MGFLEVQGPNILAHVQQLQSRCRSCSDPAACLHECKAICVLEVQGLNILADVQQLQRRTRSRSDPAACKHVAAQAAQPLRHRVRVLLTNVDNSETRLLTLPRGMPRPLGACMSCFSSSIHGWSCTPG